MAPASVVQQQPNNPNTERPVAPRVVVSEPGAVAMGSNTQVESPLILFLTVFARRGQETNVKGEAF